MTPARTTVVVVGGGISGLAAAHALHERAGRERLPLAVTVLEHDSRPGGVIRTERTAGLLLEGGPDQFVTHKGAGVDLCRRLGLQAELVRLDRQPPRTRVVREGRPVALPDGFSFFVPTRRWPLLRSDLLSVGGRLRALCEPQVPAAQGAGDESVSTFVRRRFGGEFLERVVEPIVGGIFTADTDRLSADTVLPRLRELERRHGSVITGMRRAARETGGDGGPSPHGFVTLAAGLGRLVERLVAALPPGTVRLDSGVTGLATDGNTWTVAAADGRRVHADLLILACPGPAAAGLMADVDRVLADDLRRVDCAPCATVNLMYDRGAVGRALEGNGFFVPRAAGLPLLACSYVSAKFPERVPDGQVLLRAFLGGARHPNVLDDTDSVLVEQAHRCLARLLNIDRPPVFRHVQRYESSMPQFPLGYRARREAIVQRAGTHPGLFLCGGSVGAVGVPDCIARAEQAAHLAAATISGTAAETDGRAMVLR